MHDLYELAAYALALTKYTGNNDWRFFKDVHLEKAHYKCPICEVKLDNSAQRSSKKGKPVTIRATIDHYRPMNLYDFLKYEHKNFILMCLDCNNHYKQHTFPLYPPESQRAESKAELSAENPLIINPIFDDPLEIFGLIFIQHSDGRKTLELKPKDGLNAYLLEKANETIKTFDLGDCDMATIHSVESYRLTTHSINYELFYELALARNNKKQFTLMLKGNPGLKTYGFFRFIMRKQFEFKGTSF